MLPFRALIALSASELLGISTKPYPLERPLNLFFMILTLSTAWYESPTIAVI
jgi:hypothetical protein